MNSRTNIYTFHQEESPLFNQQQQQRKDTNQDTKTIDFYDQLHQRPRTGANDYRNPLDSIQIQSNTLDRNGSNSYKNRGNTYFDYGDNTSLLHQSRWQQPKFETSLPSDMQTQEIRLLSKSRQLQNDAHGLYLHSQEILNGSDKKHFKGTSSIILNQDSTPSKGGAGSYLYSSGGGYYNQSLPPTSKYEGLQNKFMQRFDQPLSSILDQTVTRKQIGAGGGLGSTLANFNSYDGSTL